MKRETSFGEEKVRETLDNRNILTTNQLNLQNYKIIWKMLTRDAMLQHVFMDHMTVPRYGF